MGAPYGRRRDALSLSSYEFFELVLSAFFGSEVFSTQLQAEMECRATKRSPRACASKRSTHPVSETYHGAQAACRTPLPRQAWVHPKCTPCKPRFKVLKFMGKSSPRPSNSIAAVQNRISAGSLAGKASRVWSLSSRPSRSLHSWRSAPRRSSG